MRTQCIQMGRASDQREAVLIARTAGGEEFIDKKSSLLLSLFQSNPCHPTRSRSAFYFIDKVLKGHCCTVHRSNFNSGDVRLKFRLSSVGLLCSSIASASCCYSTVVLNGRSDRSRSRINESLQTATPNNTKEKRQNDPNSTSIHLANALQERASCSTEIFFVALALATSFIVGGF